jgi:N-formylglutamate amidohydrolase
VPPEPFICVEPPGAPGPVVLSSPHSGTYLPRDLAPALRLEPGRLRPLGDGPLDRLLAARGADRAAMVAATYARAFVDLNRAPLEFDPRGLSEAAGDPGWQPSVKARAGLGVVPTRLAGEPIWAEALSLGELRRRLEIGWQPYHERLERLVARSLRTHGVSMLLDLHSMPEDAAGAGRPVDVALGDRFGRSCDPRLVALVEDELVRNGLVVRRNQPYAGGYITAHHGRPAESRHALQLEFRRRLFMDEASGRILGAFDALARALGRLVRLLEQALEAPALSTAA